MIGSDNTDDLPIAILSLEKHRDGEWITRLERDLRLRNARSELVVLEELTSWEDGIMPWCAVVNRVSDAATPDLVKLTQTILLAAEMQVLHGQA